jgi:hypothetical protein
VTEFVELDAEIMMWKKFPFAEDKPVFSSSLSWL